MRVLIKLTCHWRWQLYITTWFTSSLDRNRVTYYNNNPTRRKQGQKIAIEKNTNKLIWNIKFFKNKSKDMDSIFLVMFSSSNLKSYWEKGRDGSLMLATIRDDTWTVLNMQHINQNSKRWDYSDIPGGSHKKIKEHAHMAESGHCFRKASIPTHMSMWRNDIKCKYMFMSPLKKIST